jgi:hypothetical protein
VFPRVKEKDPYRRLGVDAEASYEEVQDARNYLVDTFRGHAVGVESIEAAFDRIIQDKLSVRKKAKGLRMAKKKQGGENYVPPFMERLKAQFARPDDQVRGFFFLSRPERLPATEDCLPVPLPTRPTVYPHFEPRPSGIRVPTTNHLLPQLYPDCLLLDYFTARDYLFLVRRLGDRTAQRVRPRVPNGHRLRANRVLPSRKKRQAKGVVGKSVSQRVRCAGVGMARGEHLPGVHSDLPASLGTGTHPVSVFLRLVFRVRDVLKVKVGGVIKDLKEVFLV